MIIEEKQNISKMPLITIITVVYNGEKYLDHTIKSVLSQTYKNIEYLVVDGGSNDGTLDILKKYQNKLKWISEKDEGIYDAMNKGIGKANGDIIGIIGSDDYYDINAVKNIVNKYNEEKYDICYGNMIKIDEVNGINKEIKVIMPKKIEMVNISLVHPALFVRKNVYDKLQYNKKYKVVADRDLLYRIYSSNYKICCVDNILAYMRSGGVSSKFFIPLYEGIIVRSKYLKKKYVFNYAYKVIGSKIREFFILNEKKYKIKYKGWEVNLRASQKKSEAL